MWVSTYDFKIAQSRKEADVLPVYQRLQRKAFDSYTTFIELRADNEEFKMA